MFGMGWQELTIVAAFCLFPIGVVVAIVLVVLRLLGWQRPQPERDDSSFRSE